MVATDITLQHSTINGGVAVEMVGATVKYSWKNLTNAPPVEGKFDIVEAEYAGFENPNIVISGTIDVDDDSSNIITQQLLMDFAQADLSVDDLTLTVTAAGEGGTGTVLKGRPSAGYSVGGTYTDSLKVQVINFDVTFSAQESKEGRIWSYSLVVKETI